MITSDLYLIIRFNRINLNVPVFNISNAGLGTINPLQIADLQGIFLYQYVLKVYYITNNEKGGLPNIGKRQKLSIIRLLRPYNIYC